MSTILDTILAESITDFMKIIESENNENSIIDETSGNTTPISCCVFNLPDFVEYLSKKDIDFDFSNNDGNTALHIASYASDTRIIKTILNKSKKSINKKTISVRRH